MMLGLLITIGIFCNLNCPSLAVRRGHSASDGVTGNDERHCGGVESKPTKEVCFQWLYSA